MRGITALGIVALCVVAVFGQVPPAQTPPTSQSQAPAPTPTPPPITPAQTIQAPLFRSSVELVAVDVQVVDRDGRPVLRIPAEQFDVSIDGRRRQVVSADLIRYAQSAPGAPPRIYSGPITGSAESITGRMFVLAFDQLSFRVGQARAAAEAAAASSTCCSPTMWSVSIPIPTATTST